LSFSGQTAATDKEGEEEEATEAAARAATKKEEVDLTEGKLFGLTFVRALVVGQWVACRVVKLDKSTRKILNQATLETRESRVRT
jgi:hypothetical protein